MAPSTRNAALAKKIATLQLSLAPFVPLPHGPPHPDFPKTLFAFHLLTEEQLDSLAHYYHQSSPGVWTNHYPSTMNWDKDWLAKSASPRKMSYEQLFTSIVHSLGSETAINYKMLSDRDRIRIKRRKVGKFIGLVGMDTPTEEIVGRLQATLDRALERSRAEQQRIEELALGRKKSGITHHTFPTLTTPKSTNMNIGRSTSIRSKQSESTGSKLTSHFKLSSLRGIQQPELSKKLYKLIKAQNQVIGAYETAGRESSAIAGQLSDWGESTEDEALSDISDKLAVLLSEIADQEESFSQNLEESRTVLKSIRDTEKSVQPSRDHKSKIADEIQKLKYKEPESTKLPTLEQELVRAEAQSLVAEAQLTNVTRQKFKESFDLHTAAVIERAEKQILLAKAARNVLNLLDDKPIVPGEERPAFAGSEDARQILNDVEAGLRSWSPSYDSVHSTSAQLGTNAMPIATESSTAAPAAEETPVKAESTAVAA